MSFDAYVMMILMFEVSFGVLNHIHNIIVVFTLSISVYNFFHLIDLHLQI